MKTKIIINDRTKRSIITTALILASAIIIALFSKSLKQHFENPYLRYRIGDGKLKIES